VIVVLDLRGYHVRSPFPADWPSRISDTKVRNTQLEKRKRSFLSRLGSVREGSAVNAPARLGSTGSGGSDVDKSGFLRRFRIRRLSSSVANSSEEIDVNAGGIHETLDSLLASVSPAFEQMRSSLIIAKLEGAATRDWGESMVGETQDTSASGTGVSVGHKARAIATL
jgi:hypothetical protein